ncbi:MAG: DUF2782 domain-containing protein [Gammaproteobacteria bacterium]|nr:DUF2782 domain-containing protein [Gammaproteobacteria bacterium]
MARSGFSFKSLRWQSARWWPLRWWTTVLIAGLVLLSNAALGQETTDLADVPPPPPPVESGEYLEPDVTIVQTREETIYEYRVGGQLRAVKVVPQVGPAYYLVDADGDGRLESTRNPYGPRFLINSWVLFSW